jgi:hypothetical protein
MKKRVIFCCLLFTVCLPSYGIEIDRIGVLTDKQVILTFPSKVFEATVSVSFIEKIEKEYICEVKESDVFLRARKASAQPATLYVRYGSEDKTITYVAEIFPAEKAPIHLKIGASNSIQEFEKTAQENIINAHHPQFGLFSPHEPQQYACFGLKKEGISLAVTNIKHSGKETHLRVWINNRSTVNLKISQCSFNYVVKLRKWWLFITKDPKPVTALLSPDNIEVGPLQQKYFDFSIPTFVSNGGLELTLAESEGGARNFTIPIPSYILLEAPRK